jgi:DNA invertase Pin-like site-specific DNA recombinase
MEVAYCRVSTEDQNLDMQRAAMAKAGVTHIFEEKISGKDLKNRPELDRALAMLRPGDTLVVYKLDRLARSLVELSKLSDYLQANGVSLKSLTEPFDTATAVGRVMFQMIGVFAEFERSVLIERTKAGMAAAKSRGKQFGRKNSLTERQAEEMLHAIRTADLSISRIAAMFKISKTAVYNYCPGGREGLRERDEAANLLAKA